MKNENVHMQAFHHKLDVVLVQILCYNCPETGYSFCEDSPRSRTPPSTRMRVSPPDPFSPPLFFSLRHPCLSCVHICLAQNSASSSSEKTISSCSTCPCQSLRTEQPVQQCPSWLAPTSPATHPHLVEVQCLCLYPAQH